jgi:hypothetical protein
MNRRDQGLAERRRELIERSAAQRAALLASAEPLVRKAAVLDRVVDHVRRNPVTTSIAVGALALLGPRRIFELGARTITLLALLRR